MLPPVVAEPEQDVGEADVAVCLLVALLLLVVVAVLRLSTQVNDGWPIVLSEAKCTQEVDAGRRMITMESAMTRGS